MAATVIQASFASGELAPSMFGRVDIAKWHAGASTMRNMFINYRGGSISRAGTAWVGRCKQDASADPPRFIKFQFSITQGYVLEFGDNYMRVIFDGGYVTENPIGISAATQANPCQITENSHGYANGDWVFISGVNGMTQINGRTFIIANVTTNTYTLTDLFGENVDSTNYGAYTSAGTGARIFTLATPYAAVDLPLLKFTQSADVMSLTHPNYQPYDLARHGAASWTLSPLVFIASIGPPTNVSADETNHESDPTLATTYQYVVTAIDSVTGEESIASQVAIVNDSVDIALTSGSEIITWSPPTTGTGIPAYYNVYKAPPGTHGAGVFLASFFGYAGSTYGNAFVDNNIVEDLSVTPPLHLNPFAPGAILSVTLNNGGHGYFRIDPPTAIIGTSTGSNAVLEVVVDQNGQLGGVVVQDGGINYQPGDTITFSATHGSGATGTLNIGPETGTYPGCVAYFQQRRFYAATLNNPDTYYASQPGAFLNFDSATPPVDSDAITGTPWAVQVNGIQAMLPMPGGLVVFTGLGAWQLGGSGSFGNTAVAITPVNQQATPQAGIGCSPTVPPLAINYDILFVQSKGSIVRDLQYNFYFNIYTGTDLTLFSSHFFTGYTIVQWAWCEEPYKVVWAQRNDGILLSLTYLKEQEVTGWARHDTNGLVVSVASITEPPIDALYMAVKRYILGEGQWVYYAERMNDRIWGNVEQCWCVDAALSYPQPTPNATLEASSAAGVAGIGSVSIVNGGTGYTSPSIEVLDPTGSGVVFSISVVAGVITSIVPTTLGEGYSQPILRVLDPTGTGAVVQAVIENNVHFTTDFAAFSSGDVGSVIRMGGGIATVTQFISSTEVVADMSTPIAQTILNDPNNMPMPAPPGNWTLTVPTATVSGLDHLEGMTVVGTADGSVVGPFEVVNGAVTLVEPASQIVIGLPFLPQLQTLPLDVPGETTIQGKRKNVTAATIRVDLSRGFSVGTNQPDQSTQPNFATVPWKQMMEIKERDAPGLDPNAGSPVPLFSGDLRINLPGTWRKPGQVAVQQNYPLPLGVLAIMPEFVIGDSNG